MKVLDEQIFPLKFALGPSVGKKTIVLVINTTDVFDIVLRAYFIVKTFIVGCSGISHCLICFPVRIIVDLQFDGLI